jgi:plasmid stabilization system protein ParE
MTKVLFRAEAEADLRSIIAYFEEHAPDSIGRILSDIQRAIDLLTRFPRAGMQVPERPFRRIVTRKYHFKVAYDVGDDGVIVVLGIFRYQDRVA